jgi:hypothetical protein
MRIFEGIAVGVFVLLIGLALLFLRRAVIARSAGTIELSWRLTSVLPGRGWSPGIGRFTGDDLRWYRIFSYSIRPRRVLSRTALAVEGRRAPDGAERLVLDPDWVIVRCTSQGVPTEIAMSQSTLAGFLSWIEAVPPGTVSTRIAAR